MLASDKVIVAISIQIIVDEVIIESSHQFLRKIADGLVSIDEFVVNVTQPRAHFWEAVFQIKKDSPTTDERLKVTVDLPWKK